MNSSRPEYFEHAKWFSAHPKVFEMWCHFLWLVRLYYHEKGFMECSTPKVVECPGTEPSIDFFEVTSGDQPMGYLASSPELSLKKILALGFPKIFEVAQVFRAKEASPIHARQFHMLEVYEVGVGLDELQEHMVQFIISLCQQLLLPAPSLEVLSIPEAFKNLAGIDLKPQFGKDEYQRILSQKAILFNSDDSLDDLFFRLWIEILEPHFAFHKDKLFVVKDYPPFQAAYARVNSQSGWSQRFELIWKGIELGNAFFEVTDPDEQELRMKSDNSKRRKAGRSPVPLDENFLEALRSGLPQCSGIAIGLERLFMALFDIEKISLVTNEQ